MTQVLQGGGSSLTNKRCEGEGYAGMTNLQCLLIKTAPKLEIPLIVMKEMGK